MKLRFKISTEIERAKVHCPDAFYFLKNIEDLLNNCIIVPKEKVKIKNITFSKSKCKGPMYSMKGSLSFNSTIEYRNELDDNFVNNFMKEELQLAIIEAMEKEV